MTQKNVLLVIFKVFGLPYVLERGDHNDMFKVLFRYSKTFLEPLEAEITPGMPKLPQNNFSG